MGHTGGVCEGHDGARRNGTMKKKTPASPWRVLWLALYYAAVITAIYALHGQGGFRTPKFVYQGF